MATSILNQIYLTSRWDPHCYYCSGSSYWINFWTNTLGKVINYLINLLNLYTDTLYPKNFVFPGTTPQQICLRKPRA